MLQTETKGNYAKNIREEYDKLREGYLNRGREKNYLSIEDARKNKFKIDWETYQPVKPNKIGTQTLEVALSELVDFV